MNFRMPLEVSTGPMEDSGGPEEGLYTCRMTAHQSIVQEGRKRRLEGDKKVSNAVRGACRSMDYGIGLLTSEGVQRAMGDI